MMQLKAVSKTSILKHILGGCVVLFLCSMVVLLPYMKKQKANILNNKIKILVDKVSLYMDETGVLKDKKYYKKIMFEEKEVLSKLEDVKRRIKDKEDKSIFSIDGLVFKGRLHNVKNLLKEKALRKEIDIVEELGFGEDFPANSLVALSVRKLKLTEYIFSLLIDNSVRSIYEVVQMELSEKIDDDTAKVFCKFISVGVKFKCKTETLVKVFNDIGNLDTMIFVSDFQVKKVDDELDVNLVISKLLI